MSGPASGGGSGSGSPSGRGDSVTGMAAFRHRDFRLFFFGKMFATMSLHMVTVAIGYQVYDVTGDPMDLAYIGLAMFAPAFGFVLVTGYIADLFDRRLVVALSYLVMGIASVLFFWFTLSGTAEVWPAFLIVVLLGTGRAFYQPAQHSLAPNLVPVEEFPNAVAWNTTSNKVAQVCGPAAGGLLYLAGPEVVYATSFICCLMAASLMGLIRTRTEKSGKQPTSIRTILAGIAYIWEKKIILGAITLDMFVVLLGGVTALLPVFAKDILDVGPSGAGFLRSAMAGGGVFCALAMTQIAIRRNVGRTIFISVIVFGLATVVFGISEWYALSLVAMATLGGADMISVYIRQTLLQIATPDAMRGRVSAVNSVFVGVSNEIGEFRAGAMAALIGAIPAVIFGGVGSIVVALVCWKVFPELANVQHMDRHMHDGPDAGSGSRTSPTATPAK